MLRKEKRTSCTRIINRKRRYTLWKSSAEVNRGRHGCVTQAKGMKDMGALFFLARSKFTLSGHRDEKAEGGRGRRRRIPHALRRLETFMYQGADCDEVVRASSQSSHGCPALIPATSSRMSSLE